MRYYLLILFCLIIIPIITSCSQFLPDFNLDLRMEQQKVLENVYRISFKDKLTLKSGNCIPNQHNKNNIYILVYKTNEPIQCFIEKINYKKCPRMSIIPDLSEAEIVLFEAYKNKYNKKQLNICATNIINKVVSELK